MTTSQPKRQPIPFGKYLLLDRINIGGMAEVWRGKSFGAGGFERLVAIKRILPNIAEDDEFISMFIDEAKISVQLTHANVAQIYELGQIQSSYFIAMEYIPGKDMRAIFDRCRKKGEPAPIPLVAYCVAKMCEGLDYAHRKKDGMGRDMNIVHRDISPQNVLISYEGEVKVIDFGIAKAAGKATKTQAGILKGKFGYMSPEQIRGLPLDRRSDVFAIGVCLYEMLTGERLFVGDSDFSVLEKVRKAEVPPPSTYNRRIPDSLEKIVLKSLAKDVDERYQYANELGDDLQRFLITSDSIFSRKDLMQYMKSTFAEDVEREKQRLVDYANIKPPEGMQAAIEMGFTGAAPIAAAQPAPAAPPPAAPSIAPQQPPGRRATLVAMPKLTAAAVAPAPKDDDEGGATMLVDKSELLGGGPDPITSPGTPPMSPPTPALPEELLSHRSAVVPHPSLRSPPPTLTQDGPGAGPVPRRHTLEGLRAARSEQGGEPPTLAPAGRPAGGPPVMSPSRNVPTLGQQAAPPRPPPMVERDEEDEQDEEEEQVSEPAAPTGGKPNRMPLFAAIGAGVLLLLGAAGYFATRGPATGFLMVNVDLPAEARSKVSVTLNANAMGTPATWPMLEQVPAGPVVVMVSADGYEPFTETVEVMAGQQVARVQASLKRLVKTASLVLSTRPSDAEVKVDGKVVRPQGSQDVFIKDLPAGESLLVEVSAPGFKASRKTYPHAGSEPVQVKAELEVDEFPVRVESSPEGATIFAGGRDLGVTPATIKLPPSVKTLELRLKCFSGAELSVTPPAAGDVGYVKGSLKKIPRCR
ncbi:protein kinase [Myxococcaceae bacterium GXIMD 01537]